MTMGAVTRWGPDCDKETVAGHLPSTVLSVPRHHEALPERSGRRPKGFVVGTCHCAPTWAGGSGGQRQWAGAWSQGQGLGPRWRPRAEGPRGTAGRTARPGPHAPGAAAAWGRGTTPASPHAPRTLRPLWDVLAPCDAAPRGLTSSCWGVGGGAGSSSRRIRRQLRTRAPRLHPAPAGADALAQPPSSAVSGLA